MIRLAEMADLDRILSIYAFARSFMAREGNSTQWGERYPSRELLEEDIRREQLYVTVSQGKIHGVFAFILGEEPTYAQIEGGRWPNQKPYGTIHRIAGDGEEKGFFKRCLEFCKGKIEIIRLDTHENNYIMQHLAEKNGFRKCGVIYVQDQTPRLAYQYEEHQEG